MVVKTAPSAPISSTKINPANTTIQLRFTNQTSSLPSLHPVIQYHEELTLNKPINDNDGNSKNSNIISKSNKVYPPPRKQLQDIMSLSKSTDSAISTIDDCVFLISSEWYQQWREYCESNGTTSYPNEINNWPLISLLNNVINEDVIKSGYKYNDCRFPLKRGWILNQDFLAVSGEIWEALHCWYGGGPPLPRLVHTQTTATTVMIVDPLSILHPSSSSTVKGVNDGASNNTTDQQPNQLKQWIDLYPSNPLSLTQALSNAYSLSSATMSTSTTASTALLPMGVIDGFDDNSKQQMILKAKHNSSNDCGSSVTKVSPLLPLLSDKKISLSNSTDDSTVSSSSSSSSNNRFEVNRCNSCFVCGEFAANHCINCKAVYYCSIPCQKIHWKYHRTWCDKAAQHATLPKHEFEKLVPIGRRGKVGLFNLGNSCYMNSCLQCLSHIMPLTKYFLSQRYLNDLNMKSQDGTGGKLATEYANLLLDLWFSNDKAVSMLSLKQQLGRIRQEYAGSQQHDAHEVVELLLDKLHEDLNRVRTKPYTERPEGDGTNDEAIAAEAWKKHLLRENSVITDNVGSLMRSELTCPDCGKISVCFEYQQTLQVAIPNRNTMRIIRVLYVPCTIPKIFSRTNGLTAAGLLKLMRYRMIIMRPVLFAFKVDKYDKLGTVLKMFTTELIRYSQHLFEDLKEEEERNKKANDSIYNCLINEDPSAFEIYKSESFCLYEMTSRGGGSGNGNIMSFDSNTCLARYCREDEMVKDFNPNEDPTLGVYSLPGTFNVGVQQQQSQQQQPNILKVVLLQRKVSDRALQSILSGDNGSSSLAALSQTLTDRLNYQLTGTPSILSGDISRWSMLRLRHCVWQQISRMILHDSEPFEQLGLLHQVVELIKEVEIKGDLKKQFEFSRLLPLRLVTQFGAPRWNNLQNNPHEVSRYHQNMAMNAASTTNAVNGDSILGPAVAATLSGGCNDETGHLQQQLVMSLALDKVLGETLPEDKNITLEQYFGTKEEFVFISMDWSGNWLRLLNEHEQKYITLHETCDDLKIKAQATTTVSSSSSQQPRTQQQLDSEGIMTLESCLQEHTRQETLDEANAWYCSACKKHQCAKKNVKFWAPRLPTVLIIVLKRFEFRDVGSLAGRMGMMHREKIETLVDFPINGLDLSQFCAGNYNNNNSHNNGGSIGGREELDMSIGTVTTAESSIENNNGNNNNSNLYDLFAVCNHYGRMGFGHYTAYARDSNDNNNTDSTSNNASSSSSPWYSFDDDLVERCRGGVNGDADVTSKSAYILFYRRRNR